MNTLGTYKIRIWQWPNILSIDAALIAVLWQFLFGHSISIPFSPPTALVLALSVWLTYTADRLFDVSKRSIGQLLSTRHQFAKKHSVQLWNMWWCILIANSCLALYALSSAQLAKGVCLLGICLCYTLLNQTLSKYFFPKQLCVAIIFAGGVIIFLPIGKIWLQGLGFMFLCLMNCRLISTKEIKIDRALGERTQVIDGPLPNIALLAAILLICFLITDTATISISASAVFYLILALSQRRLSVETYRVLIDATLLIAPIYFLTVKILNGS